MPFIIFSEQGIFYKNDTYTKNNSNHLYFLTKYPMIRIEYAKKGGIKLIASISLYIFQGDIQMKSLLDKMIFSNISIIAIEDKQALLDKGILEDNQNNKNKYVAHDGQNFTRLKIHDCLIDRMVAGASPISGENNQFCEMSLSVKGVMGNLYGYSVSQYYELLVEIENHLKSSYGITVDFSCLRIKTIEINKTFELKEGFREYHRVLQLMMSNLPKSFKNQMKWEELVQCGYDHQSYYATTRKRTSSKSQSPRYTELKVYNKSKQMENVILLNEDYMRVELKLVGGRKISDALGSNYFADLSDEIISNYFQRQMERLFLKPFYNWKKSRRKLLIDLMKEQRKKDCKRWIVNTLRVLQNTEIEQSYPALLDIEELIPLVSFLGLTPQKTSQVKATFRRQAQKYETALTHNDNKKLLEILSNLQMSEEEQKIVDYAA